MKNNSLLALTASALALPGFSTNINADTPPINTSLEYKLTSYKEGNLPKQELLAGSAEWYDITVHQFSVNAPIKNEYGLTFTTTYESMSGASPWYAIDAGEGNPGIVMSGATIHEERRDFNLLLRKYDPLGSISVSLGNSNENDYKSFSGGFDVVRNFNNEMTTLTAGLSRSTDDLSPTDYLLFSRIETASKSSTSAFVSVAQIINPTSFFQSSINYTAVKGYLSDPYKLADSRPSSRRQFIFTNSYRKFLVKSDSAISIDMSLYNDDFDINSFTLDFSWHKNINRSIKITPRIRYYSQSNADFYTKYNDFSGKNIFSSSDYRLSAFGAISTIVHAEWDVGDISYNVTAERYISDEKYSLFNGPANPATVNFKRFSMGFGYKY